MEVKVKDIEKQYSARDMSTALVVKLELVDPMYNGEDTGIDKVTFVMEPHTLSKTYRQEVEWK